MVTIGGDERRVQHFGHVGKPGTVIGAVTDVLEGKAQPRSVFVSLNKVLPADPMTPGSPAVGPTAERIVSGKRRADGSPELREDSIVRARPAADGTPGLPNVDKSKAKGRTMVNGTAGRLLPKSQARTADERIRSLFDEVKDVGITVNLLEQSGLKRTRAERDVNVLEDSIAEAQRCLRGDELGPLLDGHFGLDQLADARPTKQADGCTIAALLLMNAALLHQRIAAGSWLPGITGLEAIKADPDAAGTVERQWNRIARHDFRPVIEPALDIIETVQGSGRRTGLNRAVRHLAGEAERITVDYADLGADHAGPLFNRVMGNQASDGAFFTRPAAAALLARLTLDAIAPGADWTAAPTWRTHRCLDPACGSGSLLAALMTDMKRRAHTQGASGSQLAALQKLAVEEGMAGLDINPVSLQLAAAQLIAGNRDAAYRRMQLHRMPYGPEGSHVRVGSLELLGQSRILPRTGQFDLEDVALDAEQVTLDGNDPLLEDAVEAAQGVRIVIMNPPFTNRSKMGAKFPRDVQTALRQRVDSFERLLTTLDPEMAGFADKNNIGQPFVALADRCLDPENGVLAMINPTIALTAPSGQQERVILAQRYHVHTLLTGHQPGQINLSQNTAINESMILLTRANGPRPPTRIISLDRPPLDEGAVAALHRHLEGITEGLLPDGWGEVSAWPAGRIAAGDWSAAAFRAPELAEAAWSIAQDARLPRLCDQGVVLAATGQVLRGSFKASSASEAGSFPILKSKGADGQLRIQGRPDEYWIPKTPGPVATLTSDAVDTDHPQTRTLLAKAGHLLVTAGQDTGSGRLTAVACAEASVGNGWMPARGLTLTQAQAAAVFLNSTAGRLQLMQNPGKKLNFPTYSAQEAAEIRAPDFTHGPAVSILAACWEETRSMDVPQFRDGECTVRRLWDEAVAQALGHDPDWLAAWRQLLHDEPHVLGLGRDQYRDT